MNVVGKVGSFISQGVYSVATPFHPFGGAVDVIVVQQQDGTFRSTPWYVRFGKFQGVLKGAEKMVRISVNGVEADFHMYLDNSGEAYFVKEVTSGEGSDVNGDLKDADNIEGVLKYSSNDDNLQSEKDEFVVSKSDAQKQDERISLGIDRIERTESDSERRFYAFQDEQSSLSSPVELSEYGSGRYENLDGEEHYVESQNLNSEVVLVSVDGHILTAPISSLERNTAENVQLSTPQFHLGPGQEADFCEGNADFSAGEEAWTASYLNVLGTSPQVASKDNSSSNTVISASRSQLEDSAGDEGHPCCIQGNEKIVDQERDLGMETTPEAALASIGREDIFKSCLDIPALVNYERNSCQHSMNSAEEIHENTDHSPHQFAHNLPPANEVGDADIAVDGLAPSSSCPAGNMMSPDLTDDVEFVGENSTAGHMDPCNYLVHPITHKTELEEQVKELSGENASTGHMGSDSPSVHSVTHNAELEEQFDNTLAVEQCSPQGSEDKCIGCEIIEPNKATFSASMKTDSRFEISLCGNLLHCGMGLAAAAEVFAKHQISEGDFKISAASIIKNENLVVRCRDRYLPWDKAAPIVLGAAAYGLDLPLDPKDVILVEQDEKPKLGDDSELPSIPSGRRWRLWPIPFRRVKTLEHTSSNSSNEEVFVDSESGSQNQPAETTPTSTSGNEHKQVLRTNVPTTEQIASLNLKEGQNMITFSFSTRVLGMQQVDAHIYLWKWNARIVISDVDGTITKSDVLGQFMPLVGKDWTQSGVARLFSAIKENGYQLLFLSARAIVQAYLTRSFLLNLKQDGKALPSGPVVISPDGLFPSLYREVIRRAPHEFKIACLEDIKALFPPEYNPFYAGFGNRDTDELSYRKIGIPKGKIFIINPKGEVAISQHRIDVKSYTSLHTLVNDMFPPTSMVEQEDFNSWNYWRMPLPDLD